MNHKKLVGIFMWRYKNKNSDPFKVFLGDDKEVYIRCNIVFEHRYTFWNIEMLYNFFNLNMGTETIVHGCE